MKICRKLLPLAAIVCCAITSSVTVLAQQQPEDPLLKATERLLMEAQTGYRNSVAQADIYLHQFNADEAKIGNLQKQMDGQNKTIADLQKQITDAKEAAAVAKALPAADPPKEVK